MSQISAGDTWNTVVFCDDFDDGPEQPDPERWIVNHPECLWPQCTQWLQGRTRFPNPTPWLATGEYPVVENGVLVIRHHLYDPYDSGGANGTFLGGEVHTRQEFEPDTPYRFEARVKLDTDLPSGLVASFFLYGYACSNSDEIDIEFLSKQIEIGNTVTTNTWNEGCQKPQCPCLECPCDCPWVMGCVCDESCGCVGDECLVPNGLVLTEWNTFRIYWYPQEPRIEWKWVIHPHTFAEEEVLLREECDPWYIPDEPMALYFNYWAPNEDWGCAYNASLQPVEVLNLNETFEYNIDYVEVSVPGQANSNSEVKLTALEAAWGDNFGESVSVSGETAVIGAMHDSDAGTYSGSAYVFVRSGASWTQQQKLTALDAAHHDYFGKSVSVSGDTILVGAPGGGGAGSASGSAYVFVRSGGVWTQQQKLTASDAASIDEFGSSVSVSCDTALIGAFRDNNYTGAAYVFVRSGGVWTEQQKLTALDAGVSDRFGYSVSVCGETALIGATQTFVNGFNPGSAYVFVRTGGLWTEQMKLRASDAAANDNFGCSVSLSGDTAVIGAYIDSHSGNFLAGSAYMFHRSVHEWNQQQKLTASDAMSGDLFGVSVSVNGDTALVGAYHDGEGGTTSYLGSAYVFERSGETWTQQKKLTASDAVAGAEFGGSVSMSGDTAVVGAAAHYDDASSGSAYVFDIAVCGNGILESGEQCDDGNTASERRTNCAGDYSDVQRYGNINVQATASCTEGTCIGTGDGCTSNCRIESGFTCTGEPSVCMPDCNANGIPDESEIFNDPSKDVIPGKGNHILDDCECPGDREMTFTDPTNLMTDAGQPHLIDEAARRVGYRVFRAIGPLGAANSVCWSIAETDPAITGSCTNAINEVEEVCPGNYKITLAAPMLSRAVTTLTYARAGGTANSADFTALPGDVDQSGTTDIADLGTLVNCFTSGTCHPWQCDIDRLGRCTAADLARFLDLLNNAGTYTGWNGATAIQTPCSPP